MSFKAKILIDAKEINVLWFNFSFLQDADINGRPCAKTVFRGLELAIETQKDVDLSEWAFAPDQAKQIELHIFPVILGGRTRKYYFYDCHLVYWKNHFSANGNQAMSETLHITAAGVQNSNHSAEYSASWRKTFASTVVPFKRENFEKEILEPGIIEQYWLHADEQTRIEETEINNKSILFLKVKNIAQDEKINIVLEDADDDPTNNIKLTGIVNANGEVFLHQ